jgi:prepilin signal peptidase PulO-like enzyme (type II secretory pathway)
MLSFGAVPLIGGTPWLRYHLLGLRCRFYRTPRMPYLCVAPFFGALGFANEIILTKVPKTTFGGCPSVPVILLFAHCSGDPCAALPLVLRDAHVHSLLVPCGPTTESSRRVLNCPMIDLLWTCLPACRPRLSLGAAFNLVSHSKCLCLFRWCRHFPRLAPTILAGMEFAPLASRC